MSITIYSKVVVGVYFSDVCQHLGSYSVDVPVYDGLTGEIVKTQSVDVQSIVFFGKKVVFNPKHSLSKNSYFSNSSWSYDLSKALSRHLVDIGINDPEGYADTYDFPDFFDVPRYFDISSDLKTRVIGIDVGSYSGPIPIDSDEMRKKIKDAKERFLKVIERSDTDLKLKPQVFTYYETS